MFIISQQISLWDSNALRTQFRLGRDFASFLCFDIISLLLDVYLD